MDDQRTAASADRARSLTPTYSPIHTLPDELLSLIFGYTVSQPVFALIPPMKGWWSIPWVDRHFRRVALQTPRFWATPEFVNEELLESMLSRSGVAPLTVCFDDRAHRLAERVAGSDNLALTLLTKVLLHLPRIENLTIFGSRRTIEHSRHLLQGRSAALLLCHFSMNCYESWETLPPAQQQDQARFITFSDDLLCGQAPRLRALHIHDLQLSWTSPLLSSSLVTLILTTPQHSSNAAAILSALARMPQLNHLILLNPSPTSDVQVPRPPRAPDVVTLSQLRQCLFVADIEDAPALLGTIVVPQDAKMRMICGVPDDMEDLTLVVPVAQGLNRWYEHQHPASSSAQLLAVRVQAYTTGHWDNLRISTGWDRQPDLLSHNSTYEAGDLFVADMSVDIVIARLHGTELVLSASTLLLQSLPISNVRELVLDYGVHSVTPAWWRTIAKVMPLLDTVVLHGHNASDSFFDVLAFSLAPIGVTGQDPEAPPLVQNVRNVSINGVDFAYPPRCTQAARALRRMERAQRKVHKLCLRACNIPRARVLELQAHVEMMTLDDMGRKPDPEGMLTWSSALRDFYLSEL
ncbi:unnamed protein product [Peniophora sp. CBMAI 1063]|nr:unnamed protein product [Peniophora sp. CBMAI 1063]